MPLGNSSYLQIPLMAESDNQKYLLHNDAIQALDESLNRILTLDFLGANITLTDSQLTRYGSFRGTNSTIPRTLTIPTSVGTSPAITTNRFFVFHNDGGGTITLTHGGGGTSVAVPASTVTLVLCDGTDIIAVASASGFNMGVREDGGISLVNNPTFLNFVGNRVTASPNSLGADITVTMPEVVDEGVSVQTDTTTFNFIGTGVTASATAIGNGVDITIPGATAGVNVEDGGVATVSAATILDFIGANVSVVDVGGDAHVTVSAPTAQDEGVGVQSDPTFLNFMGAGVTATANGSGVNVSIPGATSSGVSVEDEGVVTVAGATGLNFIGNNITAVGVGGTAHVTAVAPTVRDEGINVQTDPTFFNFVGAGVSAAASGNGVTVSIPGASGTSIPVDDTGVNIVASADRFNFIGTGVSVAAIGNTAEITISGGGGSALTTQDDGVQIVAATDTLNFTGPGVTVTNPSGNVTEINVAGGVGGQGNGALFWEDMTVINGDFETGNGNGWTTDVGAIHIVRWSTIAGYSAAGMTPAVNGTYFYDGGTTGSGGVQPAVESYQDINVAADTSTVFFEAYASFYKNFVDADTAFVELELRDINGNTLRRSRTTQQRLVVGHEPGVAFLIAHPDQHTLRLRIGATRNAGTNLNAGLDNVALRRASISDPSADSASSEVIQTVDFSITPVASVDVTNIDKYDEIHIVFRNVVNGGSNLRMRMSTDGGTTFNTTVGNYPYRYGGSINGTQGANTYFALGAATVSDPQSVEVILRNMSQEVPTSYESNQFEGSNLSFHGFYDQAAITDALQIYHSGVGNFTGGEVYVIGIRYSKGTTYSSPVGFHAHRTTTQVAGIITFDTEVLDEGGDYNHLTGVFTAPVGGLYHFYGAATINSGAGSGNAYIRVNGTQRVRANSFVSSGTQNDTHSAALTIRLAPGDTVDFETSFALAASVIPWNYFGGFLLNAATSNTALNVVEEMGNTLNAVFEHANGYVISNNAAAVTYTVQSDTLVNHDIGTTISIEQVGVGQVTVSTGAGVTVRSSSTTTTRTQNSIVMLTKVAPNTWSLTGDLTP